MLTRMIRTDGALRGLLSTMDLDDASLLRKVAASPKMDGLNLASVVTSNVFDLLGVLAAWGPCP